MDQKEFAVRVSMSGQPFRYLDSDDPDEPELLTKVQAWIAMINWTVEAGDQGVAEVTNHHTGKAVTNPLLHKIALPFDAGVGFGILIGR